VLEAERTVKIKNSISVSYIIHEKSQSLWKDAKGECRQLWRKHWLWWKM